MSNFFILCRGINSANYNGNRLLAILSKFKLTSLGVYWGDEDIFMQLLKIPSIQETLEHFTIERLDISRCTSVFELLVQFKRLKTIEIIWEYSEDDKLEECKQKIEQFKKNMRKKHSEIEIQIDYENWIY